MFRVFGVTLTIGSNVGEQNTFVGIAIGCIIIMSVFLSISYIYFAKAFPECMVWTLIVGSFLLFVAVGLVGIIFGILALGIVFFFLAALYALLLYCCLRGRIDTSITLVKCAGSFLGAQPSVLSFGAVLGVITAAVSVFWFVGYMGIILCTTFKIQPFNPQVSHILQIVHWILYLFFLCFFYFVSVFLVSSSVALWYYKKDQDGIVQISFKRLTIHLGSIVFSAIVITIVKALRAMMSRRGANPVGTFIFMIISFVWGAITYILKILNHYATISMAMTGQGYIASAKTAGLLIFNDVALFATVDIISGFLFYGGIIFCVGIPTILSVVILLYTPAFSSIPFLLILYMVITVLLFSLIIGMGFISTFTDALSSVFLFYCMDKKLMEYGVTTGNCPEEIR